MRRQPGAATLAAGVAGVGALLLPGLAAETAGPAALVAWAYHLAVGAALVATLAAAGTRAGGVDGVAGLAATAFGPGWRRAIAAMYVAGVTVGQAVVAAVAGLYAAALAGGVAWVALPAAAATLALAALMALAGVQLAPAARLAILAGIALALVAAALATPLRPEGRLVGAALSGGARPAGEAAFLLLFAFVGWESALTGRGRALGVGLVAALYGVAALTAQAALLAAGSVAASRLPLVPGSRADAVARLIALVAVVACAVLCGRNVAASAALARRLAREGTLPAWLDGGQRAVLAVTLGAAAGLALLAVRQVSVAGLLSVPNSMALAIYATAAAASFALLRGGRRWLALAPLAGYLLLIPFAGAAALLPLAVGTAAWLAGRRAAARHRRTREEADEHQPRSV